LIVVALNFVDFPGNIEYFPRSIKRFIYKYRKHINILRVSLRIPIK